MTRLERSPPPQAARLGPAPSERAKVQLKARLETGNAKALYAKRKQTVEPAFGIIKSAMGFARFRLRGIRNVAAEWTLAAVAYNCRRLHRLHAA